MPIKYTPTQWEVSKILKWREKGKLRIPKHQRGSAWTKQHETALIDTIYRGLPISSITLSSVDLSGNNIHYIEDGCQRICTLEKFRKNLISLDGTFFTSLPQEIQDEFLNYKIPVLIYSGATEEERIEIFDRLQNGVLLSYGERFHSMRFLSPLVNFACEILLQEDSPLQRDIEEVWGLRLLCEGEDGKRGDGTKRYKNLREAVCIMAGCLFGPSSYTEIYTDLRSELRKTLTEPQKEKAIRILQTMLDIYKKAMDAEVPNSETALSGKKLRDAFWAPKNFSGPMLYSLWFNTNDWKSISKIWIDFLIQYRSKPSVLKDRILHISKGFTGEDKYKAGWLSVSDCNRTVRSYRNSNHASDEEEEEAL